MDFQPTGDLDLQMPESSSMYFNTSNDHQDSIGQQIYLLAPTAKDLVNQVKIHLLIFLMYNTSNVSVYMPM